MKNQSQIVCMVMESQTEASISQVVPIQSTLS